MLLAYFGPETFLPVTSVIAAVAGVGLMLGRNTLSLLLWPFRRALTRDSQPAKRAIRPPHFPVGGDALQRRREAARGAGSGEATE
jgi:hypothetical protein